MSSQKYYHPLAARPLSFLHEWSEWKDLWIAATNVETLYGLLHVGFQVTTGRNYEEDLEERVVLYLTIADGYASSDTFRSMRSDVSMEGEHIRTPLAKGWPENTLRAVSQKAFVQLCTHVFSSSEHRETRTVASPTWGHLLEFPHVVDKLVWFLRLNDDSNGRRELFNGSGYYVGEVAKHHRQTFDAFALEFAHVLMGCRLPWIPNTRGCYDAWPLQKIGAIDILAGLGKLDLLLQAEYCDLVDVPCRARIHELALEKWIHDDGYRKAVSVEEACLAGSQAANIYLLLRVMQQQHKRLSRISRLKQRKDDVEQQLRNLTS